MLHFENMSIQNIPTLIICMNGGWHNLKYVVGIVVDLETGLFVIL